MAKAHLTKQLNDLLRNPVAGFKVEPPDNIYKWTLWIQGPKDTPYDNGMFQCQLQFTEDFPMKPPKLRFVSEFWHPNVYKDGTVCISILHPPGTDELNSSETAQMRWTPVQSLEKVMLSVISMIADPDPAESGAPANVDALVEWRKHRPQYIKRVTALVEKANKSLPDDFEPPLAEDRRPAAQLSEAEVTPLYDDDDDDDYEDDTDVDDETDDDDEPKDESQQYAAEMDQLRSMGIPGEDQYLEILIKCKGNLEKALDLLAQE